MAGGYRIFVHGGFANNAPSTSPAPTWTPADFTDVKYWWTADSGVNESGGSVTSWEDNINNFAMVTGSGTGPTLTTSSTLNGENVISFNGTSDFLYTTTSPVTTAGNDITILGVYNLVDVKTGGVFLGATYIGGGARLWVDTLNGDVRGFNERLALTQAFTIESPATTGAHSLKLRYLATGSVGYAYDTLTETNIGSNPSFTNQVMDTNSTVAIGATLNNNGGSVFSSRYVQIEMAEQVWVDGSPTTSEMTEWKTYVNNKYGTIIS